MKLAVNPGDPTLTTIQELCLEDAAEDFGLQLLKLKEHPRHQEQPAAQLYEPERFGMYVEAGLRAPIEHLALVNPFQAPDVQERIREAQDLTEFEEIPFAFLYDCPDDPPADKKAAEFRAAATFIDQEEGAQPRPRAAVRCSPERPSPLLPCCFLTGASALAAHALRPRRGESVLDLCAGPGAKSLVLAAMLLAPEGASQEPSASLLEQVGREGGLLAGDAGPRAGGDRPGRLVLNEPNKARAMLLEDALASFLPEELLGKGGPVTVTRLEAAERPPLALQRLGPFDKVLVDPPCTDARQQALAGKSQRLEAQKDSTKLKKNTEIIEATLRCAASLVRPGGLIVYCTTSLQERENDEAVRRFLRRAGPGEFEVEPGVQDDPIEGAVCTSLGTMVMPNQRAQHGPLYFARLRRVGK